MQRGFLTKRELFVESAERRVSRVARDPRAPLSLVDARPPSRHLPAAFLAQPPLHGLGVATAEHSLHWVCTKRARVGTERREAKGRRASPEAADRNAGADATPFTRAALSSTRAAQG